MDEDVEKEEEEEEEEEELVEYSRVSVPPSHRHDTHSVCICRLRGPRMTF